MNTAGTWYYPPCAGTGNLLLANPPFIFQSMDTNQPTPADNPLVLTEQEFLGLSAAAGGSGHPFEACNYGHSLRIAQRAYRLGADAELKACCEWLEDEDNDGYQWAAHLMRTARRPKPPTLKEQALAVLDDCSDRLDAAHENTLRRALEGLPD
jgi:hypothetical protein